jgi:cob(I)alamin adenosyltransferase
VDIILTMAPFYTRSGDDGTTGILGEGRVPKYHPRPEACGTVDEASAALGLARALARSSETAEAILQIQRDLYHLMSEIAAEPKAADRFRLLGPDRVEWLEDRIDDFAQRVELPDGFILPGDAPAGAALDLARTVVRRAERLVVRLAHQGTLDNPVLLRYLNRLSSLCFVLELWENRQAGGERPSLAKGEIR